MKRFTDAGRHSVQNGNLYGALTTALILPDICGSLEDPGPNRSRARYERWCKTWVEPRFTVSIGPTENKKVFVSAEDLYQIRCSLIHSGRSEIESSKIKLLERYIFCDYSLGSHMNAFNINGRSFLQLKVDLFCKELFDAADSWDQAMAVNDAVRTEKQRLLFIQSKGFIVDGVKIS